MTDPPWVGHRGPPRLLDPHDRAAVVDLPGLVEAGQVDVDGPPHVRVGGGVVDEDVDATEPLDRGRDAGGDLVGLAGIGGEHRGLPAGGADLVGRRLERVLLARREHHVGARPGEGGGDRLADPAAGAGDQGDLPLQADLHPQEPNGRPPQAARRRADCGSTRAEDHLGLRRLGDRAAGVVGHDRLDDDRRSRPRGGVWRPPWRCRRARHRGSWSSTPAWSCPRRPRAG